MLFSLADEFVFYKYTEYCYIFGGETFSMTLASL